MLRGVAAAVVPPLVVAAVAGCGSSAAKHATSTAAPPAATGKISVVYDPPRGADARIAKEVLHLGGTDGVAAGLTKSFALPANVTIHAVNAPVGPSFNPDDRAITLSYPFVNYVAGVLRTNLPHISDYEFGRELAAIDGFLLMHEFGHAVIDLYRFPVLGREEDAADALAAVFLLNNVSNGAEYAFDAARFFYALSARQRHLAPSDYWDAHSLDAQRAYSIVCWIAGSTPEHYKEIARLRILDRGRLATCPAEYRQKVVSWETLLKPHLRQ